MLGARTFQACPAREEATTACSEEEASDGAPAPRRAPATPWRFLATLAGTLAIAAVVWCRPGARRAFRADVRGAQGLSEGQCAKLGENCAGTGRCCTEGMQCYQKDENWAVCNFTCTKEVHSFDADNKPWSCGKLGERTPSDKPIVVGYGKWGEWLYLEESCSKTAEDCSKTRRCCDPGMQCYAKNGDWASCNATCTREVHAFDADKKPWSCKELGKRTPQPSCGWPGLQCVDLKCCRIPGQKCFFKKYGWAACMKECEAPWNCSVVGEHRAPPTVEPAPEGKAAGRSLYCFSVVSRHLQHGVPYERDLIDMHRDKGVGIFACDAADVYDAPVLKGKTAQWGSFSNTAIFLKVWEKVKDNGAYKSHDWTVKVDPDAVLLPDRLRRQLVKLSPPSKTALYLKNTWFKFGFMGSCEVLSKEAVNIFVEQSDDCAKNLGVDGGEDFWTMQCLDALGVPHMTAKTLLNDKYTQGDAECQKTLTCKIDWASVEPCGDTEAAAFHPYKSEQIWSKCYRKATNKSMDVQVTM